MRMVLTGMTVGKWRRRFRELGLVGLHDELRPGRPRSNEDDKVAEVIHCALQTKPTDGSTPWSARTLAAASGISKTTGHRWPQTFSVQPQRQNHVMLATDPLFVENVRDNVGLYWKPPDKAMVLCVDEMTQSQALERTPPLCPWAWVAWRGVTHADIRHDTTTLFAALDVVTGEVISPCKPRHRHQEFLGFLRLIEKSVPEGLEMHLIVANTCTPRLAMVLAWLAQRHRFHLHDTPTYASWLNQVEHWFGILTQRAMRCGSFSSVKELIARIEQFVAACNKTKAPSNWTATTDSILAKLQRHGSQICGTAP